MEYEEVIEALKHGTVPPEGSFEICVGRDGEINEFQRLLDKIGKGKATTKFIEGKFGSGKSFLLKMLEEKALERNYVVSKITITRDVPFNKFEEVYRKIVSTLKCKTGVSLQHIIDRWITGLKIAAKNETSDISEQTDIVTDNIRSDLEPLRKYSNSFATAIENYYNAKSEDNREIADYAQAWLRCDDNIPFVVKRQFGVKGGVTKENAFEFLKALSAFIDTIGYDGLVILIDEIEFITNLPMRKSRDIALDYIRYICDECAIGNFDKTLFVMAGTNDFYEDSEKGLKSYKALSQRLEPALESEFKDMRNPIIKLDGFNKIELIKLSENILKVYSNVYGKEVCMKFEGVIDEIIDYYREKSLLTGSVKPREYVKGFVSALDIVQQNPAEFDSKNKVIDLFDNLEWVKFDEELESLEDTT